MNDATAIKTISKLSEYLDEIGNYPSAEYIYRGEHCYFVDVENKKDPKPYDKRLSGAFRKTETVPNRNSIFISFMKRVERYYELVGHRLSDVEKEHFIAFSQHHWLQTNLLDITSAPLVALFMACDGTTGNGHVYILDKDYIDITDVLALFSRAGFLEQNITEFMIKGEVEVLSRFYKLLKNHISDTFYGGDKVYDVGSTSWLVREPSVKTKERICKLYHCSAMLYNYRRNSKSVFAGELLNNDAYNRVSLPEVQTVNYDELIKMDDHRIDDYVYNLAKGTLKESCMTDFPNIPHLEGWQVQWPTLYLVLLVYFLKQGRIVFSDGKTNFCKDCSIRNCEGKPAFLPNLVYRPKITFDRARAQQGFFIYQPYINVDSEDLGDIALFQETICVKEIKVENTNDILKQLDEVGINRGTIYGDYDSIAKYVRESKV